MSINAGPNIVENGLVLYLDAANSRSYPGSGTTWTDLSLNSNNGTLINAPTYSTSNNGYFIFVGGPNNNYINIGFNQFPFGASPGTISAWALTNNATTIGYSWIISYGYASISQARFLGILNSTYLFGGYGDDVSASGVSANTWFNMVGVYDGTNASMYINGNLVSGPTSKSWNTVSGNAQIGRQVNTNEYWNGKIGQVSVYNRALSATEILQNFNATRARYGI